MVWVVLISLISSASLASVQSRRSSPDRQERTVMGRPEESRLRVGGAVEAGDASGDGMVHVGGGMIMSPAEVGWGGRDSTPAEVGTCGGRGDGPVGHLGDRRPGGSAGGGGASESVVPARGEFGGGWIFIARVRGE